MLELIIPEDELFDGNTNKFIVTPACTLTLEHSLISIAKWESKWNIPFLSAKKTDKQHRDYIRCMCVIPVKNDNVFATLSPQVLSQIKEYIDSPMTATTFPKRNKQGKRLVVTAEVIYSRMFANNIPIECQKWHLNRLLTLIRACEINNGPGEKMSKRQTASMYAQQNALRKAKYGTRG
ncbi:MAG: hypothetical protein RR559_08840 [Bacteroides sp.]